MFTKDYNIPNPIFVQKSPLKTVHLIYLILFNEKGQIPISQIMKNDTYAWIAPNFYLNNDKEDIDLSTLIKTSQFYHYGNSSILRKILFVEHIDEEQRKYYHTTIFGCKIDPNLLIHDEQIDNYKTQDWKWIYPSEIPISIINTLFEPLRVIYPLLPFLFF
jgi:hypothetical protein